jgi:hypothetical protein
MYSEDVIAEQASLRTAAFEQQHEDRSHALELHSDQIVEHIAWYSGIRGSDRLEWHSDLRVTGGFETLKLPVPHSVVTPLEHTRPPKVLRTDPAVSKCNNGRQSRGRRRRRAFCPVYLPSVGDEEFAKQQQIVAASFNPDD